VEAGDSVILIMPGQEHLIWEHIPTVALTAGVTHRPMLAMATVHMQLILQAQPILTVLTASAEASAEALAEALAEADGGKA
jgi:hypothetical protein